ncbi:hypothetical protein E1286_05375 [Nonomuraea terrae]|uniref:Uncharacterized protein n=1 Tax=Nonomuraea terrae TaxID=2530383 RepID=A0A4R4ZA48_9ACTN|nr:hypothetical protein [Nonomuraea terrae]TDD54620.1 hypothetical protein E1286_05375 [Nonomuraea terrae]
MSHGPNVVSLTSEKQQRIVTETDALFQGALSILQRVAAVRHEAGLPMPADVIDLRSYVPRQAVAR